MRLAGFEQVARRSALALAAALVLLPGSLAGAEAPTLEDLPSRPWYYTEVVVFERPAVLDHLSTEALTRAPAPLPRTLHAFRTPGRPLSAGYPLYPVTHAYLAFPYLDRRRLLEDDAAAAGEDAADPGAVRGRPAPAIRPRLGPDPLLDMLSELARWEAGLEAQSYQWLSPETFTLRAAADRLARRGGYRVLLHGRWLQPVPPRDAPQSLLIRSGPRYGEHHALEGTFDVTLGRYLHFRALLYYTEPLLGRAPVDQPQPPAGAAAARRTLTDSDFTPRGVMQLRESRRLRSDELHYLDHPKLGVLVRMEAAAPPPSVAAALAALSGEAVEEDAQ